MIIVLLIIYCQITNCFRFRNLIDEASGHVVNLPHEEAHVAETEGNFN